MSRSAKSPSNLKKPQNNSLRKKINTQARVLQCDDESNPPLQHLRLIWGCLGQQHEQ